MKKRLFIAIDLPKDIKEHIKVLEKEIDRKFGQKLFWINEENLHLTLLFLGYIDEQKIDEIVKLLNGLSKPEPFQLKINQLKYGPDERVKRMIWLIFEESKELQEFQQSIECILEKGNIPFHKEHRPYLPHINLIRFKEKIYKPPIQKDLNFEFKVESFILKESVLKRSGAEYRDVALFSLS